MPGPAPFTEEEFAEKFWARVDKVSDISGCWIWTARKDSDGYGRIMRNGKHLRAHRVSYILSGKTIPEGLLLRHSENCVGKANCVNPEHLTPGTEKDNRNDMVRDGTVLIGAKNPSAKLTEAQVLEIRAIVDKTQMEIAEIYNVGRTTIRHILTRETWKHI